MLPSAHSWCQILNPVKFVRVIDTSIRFLFGWTADQISQTRKLVLYHHLYSYSSVKSVVHW